jgi:hypothetical protein
MASQILELIVRAKDQASSVLTSVGRSAEQLGGKMRLLGEAASVAGGVLIADLVRNTTAFAQESLRLGGQLDTLTRSFTTLAAASGGNVASLEELRDATQGTVADVDLLKAANQALLLGLPTEELDELMGSAVKLGHAMGIDSLHAVESLTTGLGRQSKLILDNLGIVFQASDAYDWYAAQIGKSSRELTESEKRLGWQKYAMMLIAEKADALGDSVSGVQVAQERWNASIRNMQAAVGSFLGVFGPLIPAFESLMPLLGTMAGTMLPSLITKTNLLAAANKVLAVGKALVNKQTYVAIGVHIKHTAAIVAEKVATLAAKAATWLLNAALATKVALLTLGVGVIAAAAAATYSLAQMTAAAAESEERLGGDVDAANVSLEAQAQTIEDFDRLYGIWGGHLDWMQEKFVEEFAPDLEAAHKRLVRVSEDTMRQIASAYKQALAEERWTEAARMIADFARAHDLSFSQAKKAIDAYVGKVELLADAVEAAVPKYRLEFNRLAAESSRDLEAVARSFDAAFAAGRFQEAADLVGDFAEAHRIAFSDAEEIILDYTEQMKALVSAYDEALAVVQAFEAEFKAGLEEAREAQAAFTAELEHESNVLLALADTRLPDYAEAFAEAFAERSFQAALGYVMAFANKYRLTLDEAKSMFTDYLEAQEDAVANVDFTFPDLDLPDLAGFEFPQLEFPDVGDRERRLYEFMHSLQHESNVLEALADRQLPKYARAFADAFAGDKFTEALRIVATFASRYSLALEEAKRMFTDVLEAQERDAEAAMEGTVDAVVGAADAMAEELRPKLIVLTGDWQAKLAEMREQAEQFSNDVVMHSIWTDMLAELVGQTEAAMASVTAVAQSAFSAVEGEVKQIELPSVEADVAEAHRTVTAFTDVVVGGLAAVASEQLDAIALPAVTVDLEGADRTVTSFSRRLQDQLDKVAATEVEAVELPGLTVDVAATERTLAAVSGLITDRLTALSLPPFFIDVQPAVDFETLIPEVVTAPTVDIDFAGPWLEQLGLIQTQTEETMQVVSAVLRRGFDALQAQAAEVDRTVAGVGEGLRVAALRQPVVVALGPSGAEDRSRDAARSLVIQGPLVNIEGSADRRTAEYAAGLVAEKLKSIVRETTSSGANVKTERIRLPSVGDFAGRR